MLRNTKCKLRWTLEIDDKYTMRLKHETLTSSLPHLDLVFTKDYLYHKILEIFRKLVIYLFLMNIDYTPQNMRNQHHALNLTFPTPVHISQYS